MSEFRYPLMTGKPEQQLEQVKSFLFQHIDALNFTIQNLENRQRELEEELKRKGG